MNVTLLSELSQSQKIYILNPPNQMNILEHFETDKMTVNLKRIDKRWFIVSIMTFDRDYFHSLNEKIWEDRKEYPMQYLSPNGFVYYFPPSPKSKTKALSLFNYLKTV